LALYNAKNLPHVYIALGPEKFAEWMKVYNEGGKFEWPTYED